MPPLQIPKPLYQNFQTLLRIAQTSSNEIIDALSSLQYTINISDVTTRIFDNVENVTRDEAEQIVGVIVSLYNLMTQNDQPADEIASAISIAAAESKDLAKPDGWHRDQFSSLLSTILKVGGSLEIVSKGMGVLNDHEHLYCDARILTDIRPIFTSEAAETPHAVVIVHNLKIVYHAGREHKEFFVALDTSDLQKMLKVLQRAEAKANSMKPIIEKAKLHYLDVEGKEQ